MVRIWMRARSAVLLAIWGGATLAASAEEIKETYPDGTTKAVYSVDEQGQKSGLFKEYHPNGRLKTQGGYRADKLNGRYKRHFADGRVQINAGYKDGTLSGKYEEHAEGGSLVRSAAYRDGKLHGPQKVFKDRRLVRDEVWSDGVLLLPKSEAQIRFQLKAIGAAKIETVGSEPDADASVLEDLRDPAAHRARQEALRMLMAYRCLCNIPYGDLVLDRTYIAHCEAGSELMRAVDQMTHTPKNPGWPESRYRFAYAGCSKSNIYSGGDLVRSVHAYMGDSDKSNNDRVGHRRWLLNPRMGKIGFGRSGKYAAAWVMDESRRDVPDFDYVAYPARGLFPDQYFKNSYAWSVSPNPAKYRPGGAKSVKVSVTPVVYHARTGNLEKSGGPLELDYFNVSEKNYGIPNCIIFKPKGVDSKPGAAYWVEISGLVDRQGKPAPLEYLVSFFRL